MKRRTMKGARKRQCSVCLHRVFHAYASPFVLERVENGRAPGSAKLLLPAHQPICGVCMNANPLLVPKVNALPVAYATKTCHRCGGTGRVAASAAVGARWKSVPAEDMSCPSCGGSGEVPA